MKSIRIFVAAFIAAAVPFHAFPSIKLAEKATQKVTPGDIYQVDCSWRIADLPRTSWIHPQLEAFDAGGKRVFFRWDAGRYMHRAFDPSDPYIEKWRFYVQVKTPSGGNSKVDQRFSMGLATLVVPAESDRFEVAIVEAGDPSRHTDGSVKIVKLSAPPAKPSYKVPPFDNPSKILGDAELDARLAVAPRLSAALKSTGSRTTMLVDGKPVVPRIWKGGKAGEWQAVEQFGKCGFNLFKIQLELRNVWREDGSIDTREIREDMRKCLKVNPDAMLLFQVSVRPRKNWGIDNPGEVFRNGKGGYAVFKNVRVVDYTSQPIDKGDRYAAFSYMSEKFTEDAGAAIRRIFEEIESWPESKNLVAAYVCGGADNQWLDLFDNSSSAKRQAADYSPASVNRFRKFLRAKYGTPEKMRDAWGAKDAIPFENVEVPPEDAFWTDDRTFFRQHGSTPESDWRRCWARSTNEMRLWFARMIKETTGGRVLVGSYCPHGGLEGFPLISKTDTKTLLASPDYDFFAVVPAYARDFANPIRIAAYTGSCARRGKLYISELDLRNAEVNTWGVWGTEFWRENHNARTFRRKAIQYAVDAFVHGGAYHACDMSGGYYNTPAAMETWTAVNRIADHVRAVPVSPHHVAIVGGEEYWDYQSMRQNRVLPYYVREMTYLTYTSSGLPHESYLLDEVLQDPGAEMPKMIVFNDLTTATPEQFRELRRRYANGGRVLVYSWRLGLFAPGGDEIEREMGLVPCPSGFVGKQVHADGQHSDPLMDGVKGLFLPLKHFYGDPYATKLSPSPEKGWKTLACFDGSDVPAVAVRRHPDFTEVYSSVPNGFSVPFLRNLARSAGFRPIVETDDLSGFGSGLFYIVAQTDGTKKFLLPDGAKLGKVLEGPEYRIAGDGSCEVELKRSQIFVLQVVD